MSIAQLRRRFGERLGLDGSILSTVTITAPNCLWTGALTSPSLSEKAASATVGSTIADFGHGAEIDVLL